jgi:hypothetical protein
MADPNVAWAHVAQDVERGDHKAIAELYEFCSAKVRWYLQRSVRFEDIDDSSSRGVHNRLEPVCIATEK